MPHNIHWKRRRTLGKVIAEVFAFLSATKNEFII